MLAVHVKAIDLTTAATNSEDDYYNRQSAVEDWALDAMWAARDGHLDTFNQLVERFEHAVYSALGN